MIKILKSGFYSSIQDLGRFGYQEFGVPYSGAMDQYSAKLANAILGNDENAAVLEMTMTGPELQFNYDTQICISGANISPSLNKMAVHSNKIIEIKDGDVLSFGKLVYGFRGYIAIFGGFNTDEIMKSRSMYNGITNQFKLFKNDTLSNLRLKRTTILPNASIKINPRHFKTEEIEVLKGPEFELLSDEQKDQINSQNFTVSKYNNRMAYQLDELVVNNLKPIITSLVLPGTVQLTPHGTLIILMRDCQTTGGYPRILQLGESAINKLAQKFAGDSFYFMIGKSH